MIDMSVLDAAYNVGEDYPGGAAGLALRMGRNATTFSHELRRTGTAKLGLADAVKMSVLSGDYRVAAAFAHACGFMLVPLPDMPDISSDDCMRRLGEVSQEFAELCAGVCAAMADNVITENELGRFRRDKGNLVADLVKLDQALSRKHESTKPGAAT